MIYILSRILVPSSRVVSLPIETSKGWTCSNDASNEIGTDIPLLRLKFLAQPTSILLCMLKTSSRSYPTPRQALAVLKSITFSTIFRRLLSFASRRGRTASLFSPAFRPGHYTMFVVDYNPERGFQRR